MNVKELKEFLQQYEDHIEIYCQTQEGGSCSLQPEGFYLHIWNGDDDLKGTEMLFISGD